MPRAGTELDLSTSYGPSGGSSVLGSDMTTMADADRGMSASTVWNSSYCQSDGSPFDEDFTSPSLSNIGLDSQARGARGAHYVSNVYDLHDFAH